MSLLTERSARESKLHVVEATSKDPNFLYSKMIWYLDPEDWQMRYSDRYDRSGKLWKIIDQLGFVGNGQEWYCCVSF